MQWKLNVRWPACFVVAIYLAASILCFTQWTNKNWFPVTGDEPHYLIMASGIAHFGTLEQTRPYAREFAQREIYQGVLAAAGTVPTPINTHSIKSKNGLFNIHGAGLPLLLALPFSIGGVVAAKLFLVALSCALAIFAWKFTAHESVTERQRIAAVIAATCSLPFIPAAAQVYPDLLAGICALSALWWLRVRRAHAPLLGDAIVAVAIALLPWLQIKFSAVAIVACTGLTLGVFNQSRQLVRSAIFMLTLVVSFAGLAAYNIYAFDNAAGPYGNNALVINLTALMVFLGLHFDQFQGLFAQNPAFFAALLFLAPYCKTHRLEAATALLMYLAIVVPSAMHPVWYGGFSFAGRFMWAGAAILLPAALFGLTRLARAFQGRGIYVVCLFIVWNFYVYLKYTAHRFEFYNVPKAAYWPESASSFYPALKSYLPIMQDASWAFYYPQNGVVLVFAIGLVLIGVLAKYINPKNSGRIIAGHLVFCAALLIAASKWIAIELPALVFPANTLSSQNGVPDGTALTTWGPRSGYLTFGPHIPLASGKFRFAIDYSASQSGDMPVGSWDVYVAALDKVLKTGTFPPGNTHGTIEESFFIDAESANRNVEIRTYYAGDNAGSLTVRSLILEKLDASNKAGTSR